MVPKTGPGGPRDLGPDNCSRGGLPRSYQARLHDLQLLRDQFCGDDGLSFTIQMTHLEESCPHIEDRNHSVLESVFRGHRRCIKRRKATVVFIGKSITFFSCFVIGFFFLLPSVSSTEALCEAINRCRLRPEFDKTQFSWVYRVLA